MIRFFNNDVKLVLANKLILKKWIKLVSSRYEKSVGDLNIIFCSDEKLLAINMEFLKHNYYTDIITFDYSDVETLEGELYISLDTVRSNAEEFGVSFLEELHRVIIHGVLHMCGFDDKSNAQKKVMRVKENEALECLNNL